VERAEAKALLMAHSYLGQDHDHPAQVCGFLGCLRPWQGLREENFQQVLSALDALSEELLTSPTLDRDIINALWGICYLSRSWGVEPGGMLRRHHLIGDEEIATLATWIDIIETRVLFLLDGSEGHNVSGGLNYRVPKTDRHVL
jgi:hypothetical protein